MDETKKDINPVTTSQEQVSSGEVASLPRDELETLNLDGVDPIFEAQAQLINHAVQCIGMGRVQCSVLPVLV